MANGNGNDDETGSKDRTTVALVGAEIREIKAILTGHAELTAERFQGLRETIAPLRDIPNRVTKLEGRVANLEETDEEGSQRRERMRDWKRATAATALMATVGIIVNLALTYHWFG